MSRAEWGVMRDAPGLVAGECTRCGEQLEPELPASLSVLTAAINAFVKVHARCKPKEET